MNVEESKRVKTRLAKKQKSMSAWEIDSKESTGFKKGIDAATGLLVS